MIASPASQNNFNIRRAGINDLELIYQLVKQGFNGYNRRGINPALAESRQDIFADLEQNIVLVMECHAKIIATLRLESKLKSSVYLKRFSVAPAFQKKGLGGRLYLAAEDFARKRGIKFIYLHSSLENRDLINFYDKLGFVCLKTDQENGYQRGLWVKRIEGVE